HQRGHASLAIWIMKQVLSAPLVPQALMQMSAATRQRSVPLGHEGSKQSVSGGQLFHDRLEQSRFVRRTKTMVIADGGLVDTRTCLRVQAFELDIEIAQRI